MAERTCLRQLHHFAGLGKFFCPLHGPGGVSLPMMVDDSQQLLREYSGTRSENAFRALVRKHSGLVYGTALRKLAGDKAAAEDVTQEVFTLLARKAGKLQDVTLSGWLYCQACRRAANHVRSESRRRNREKAAVQDMICGGAGATDSRISHELDEALLQLPTADRDAVVLRFFEAMDYRKVGDSLGITEEAARKKIRRALDRMEAILKRKGLTFGTASLGTSLAGLDNGQSPATLVTRLNGIPLKQASAIGSGPLVALLKPALAGALLVSAGAGSTLALQKFREGGPAGTTPPPAPVASRSSSPRAKSPATGGSFASIISEIKRLHGGPENTLNAMRLDAALEKIPDGRIPEFIALANDEFSQPERKDIYERLLMRWLAADAGAAMDYALTSGVADRVDGNTSLMQGMYGPYRLLVNLYEAWVKQDRNASGEWLISNWSNPGLDDDPPPLRITMARDLAQAKFREESAASMAAFLRTVPTSGERQQVMEALVGRSTRHTYWEYADNKKRMALHEALETFATEPWYDRLMIQNMNSWNTRYPERFRKAMEGVDSTRRFQMMLGLIAASSEWKITELDPPERRTGGSTRVTGNMVAIADRPERADGAMRTAADAGIPRTDAFRKVTRALAEGAGTTEALAWFDKNRPAEPIDDLLVEAARNQFTKRTTSPEAPAIEWASRISDGSLRHSVTRGAFRMMMAKGQAGNDPAKFLETTPLPDDVRTELKALLENPQ